MFKVPEGAVLQQQVSSAEKNYLIAKNDKLQLEVYTNNGERIIDPDFELSKDVSGQVQGEKEVKNYLVDVNGVAKFPLIDEIKIEGLTIRQAEDLLQKEYSKFYKEPFVVLGASSRRVIVLGSPGGQVIPLVNENVRLVEILALAKGIDKSGKAHNIRILRGQQVFVADLTTIEGYLKNNMLMEPGDVVYVEPIRKPFIEGLQEYGAVISVIASLTTLIVILTQSSN